MTNNTIPQTYKVTTENDVEGRTTRTIGYFFGTPLQIAEYLLTNGIKPYYNFYLDVIDIPVKDVTFIDKPRFVQVVTLKHTQLHIVLNNNLKDELEQVQKRNQALAKLTDEEKKILGLL